MTASFPVCSQAYNSWQYRRHPDHYIHKTTWQKTLLYIYDNILMVAVVCRGFLMITRVKQNISLCRRAFTTLFFWTNQWPDWDFIRVIILAVSVIIVYGGLSPWWIQLKYWRCGFSDHFIVHGRRFHSFIYSKTHRQHCKGILISIRCILETNATVLGIYLINVRFSEKYHLISFYCNFNLCFLTFIF